MRLTTRCRDLLRLLRAARWLSTSQIHRRFFASATKDAARKRVRILTEAGYLAAYQPHRMAEAFYTLGPEGKRALECDGTGEITLERKPPKQLAHLAGINDIRIAAELEGELAFFFACWELPAIEWRHRLIPDAVFSVHRRTLALEFDRGAEGVRYFVATKIPAYERGFDGFPLSALVVVADRDARLGALSNAIRRRTLPVFFTRLDLVRECGLGAPIFRRHPERDGRACAEGLFSNSPDGRRGVCF